MKVPAEDSMAEADLARAADVRVVIKRSGVSPHFKLLEYIDRLADELRSSLAKSCKGNVDAVHDARVATRRLRAFIELFDEHLSKRLKSRFRKSLKRIRKTLGNVRDLDIMIEYVAAAKGLDSDAADFILNHLKREREDELQMLSDLSSAKILGGLGSWWGLREQITAEMALPLLRESLLSRLDEFCLHADMHCSLRLETELPAGSSPLTPHELRIIGKALRYTVEMAIEEGVKIPWPVMRTFKRIQDLLGLWHDQVVLTGKVLEICVDELLTYSQPQVLKKSMAFAQSCSRRAEKRLNDFSKLWKERGASMHSQIIAALDEAFIPMPFVEADQAESPEIDVTKPSST